MPDFEWTDDDHDPSGRDEELAGHPERKPVSRRTRVVVAALTTTVVGAAVVAAVAGSGSSAADGPTGSASSSGRVALAPVPTFERTFALEPAGTTSRATTAIKAAFPGIQIIGVGESFGTVRVRFYSAADARRRVQVVVRPVADDTEHIGRSRTTVRIAQRLRGTWIDVTVTARRGAIRRADFESAVRLVRDVRLLT